MGKEFPVVGQDQSKERERKQAAQTDRKNRQREREEQKMGLAVLLLAALALPCVSWAETEGNSMALAQDQTARDIQVRLMQ